MDVSVCVCVCVCVHVCVRVRVCVCVCEFSYLLKSDIYIFGLRSSRYFYTQIPEEETHKSHISELSRSELPYFAM